jgi:glycosyltransferase involved in cell wall biosynthesis
VNSVLSQPEVDVRILVIDDASSDETSRVGEELARSNNRIEFFRHEANKGNIATYNEGLIDWSVSKYVVLLSADDMLTPGSLSRAVHIMETDETIGMVYGPAIGFKEEAELSEMKTSKFSYTRFPGAKWVDIRCRAGYNVIASPEVVVRGSVQRAVGGYRSELPHSGDLEMWLRIAAVSNVAYVRRVPQAFYRMHGANMTKERNSLVDLRQRKAAFDAFFQHHPEIDHADHLHDLANRALACEALWRACRAYDRNQVVQAYADELVDFAANTYPAAKALREYKALRRRRYLGPLLCHRTQVFAATALLRRGQAWIRRRRWKKRGI